MTHGELVKAAAKWLATKHAIVITEMASGAMEEPDAIGFQTGFSTLVECKASRADFFADKNKPQRRGSPGMGDKRYFLTRGGLVEVEEVPEGWGLLYADGRGVRTALEATQNENKNFRGEQQLLTSCLRRIGACAPAGISIKCYTYETKNRASLGVEAS